MPICHILHACSGTRAPCPSATPQMPTQHTSIMPVFHILRAPTPTPPVDLQAILDRYQQLLGEHKAHKASVGPWLAQFGGRVPGLLDAQATGDAELVSRSVSAVDWTTLGQSKEAHSDGSVVQCSAPCLPQPGAFVPATCSIIAGATWAVRQRRHSVLAQTVKCPCLQVHA